MKTHNTGASKHIQGLNVRIHLPQLSKRSRLDRDTNMAPAVVLPSGLMDLVRRVLATLVKGIPLSQPRYLRVVLVFVVIILTQTGNLHPDMLLFIQNILLDFSSAHITIPTQSLNP